MKIYVNGEQMWVSGPLEVTVALEGLYGFEGDVTLSVGAPSGINAWFENEVLHVSSLASTILYIEVPTSNRSMVGTHDLSIRVVSDVSREPSEDDYYYDYLDGNWCCLYCDYAYHAPPWDHSVIDSHIIANHPDELTVRDFGTYTLRVVRPETKITSVEFLSTDAIYETPVYWMSVPPQVRVGLWPGNTSVESSGRVSGPGYFGSDMQTTSGTSVTHTFSPIGRLGKFSFTEELEWGNSRMDFVSESFYVVFDRQNDVADWYYTGTTTDGGWDWLLNFLWKDKVTLHPHSREILNFIWGYVAGSTNKEEAAERLVSVGARIADTDPPNSADWWNLYIGGRLWDIFQMLRDEAGCYWDTDFKILDINGENPKGHACGTCSDHAAAYLSCVRSIGLPARLVQWEGSGKKSGHAFCEVYIDNRWVHADSYWSRFDEPDAYIQDPRNFRDLEFFIEYEPGKMQTDQLTTVKYAVGVENSSVTINVDGSGNGENQVPFVNLAKSGWFVPDYTAENFSVEVIDNGGLNLNLSQLSGDSILNPGEEDRATLRVWGAASKVYTITLKLSYSTWNGAPCEKLSTVYVDTRG